MGLEVFELDYQQAQDRAIEVTTAADVVAIPPCPDLSIRVSDHRADGDLIDALQAWLDADGAGLETLTIDASWIYVDRLAALDLRPCSKLLGLWARSIHLSSTLFELSELEYLVLDRSVLPIEGPLVIDGSSLPRLANCHFSDTRVGTSEVVVANADHLQGLSFAVDQDYADGSDPSNFRVGDCPELADVWIDVFDDLRVEIFGDLPALQNVWINPHERTHEFEHGLCRRHPDQEMVEVYDDDRGEYEMSVSDYDGTAQLDRYRYRF